MLNSEESVTFRGECLSSHIGPVGARPAMVLAPKPYHAAGSW